jgi:hypothetical protein
MSTTLAPRRLFVESLPVAAVLSLWVVCSWLAPASGLATGLRLAGVVMAVSYVVVRGVTLARSRRAPPLPTDVAGLLRENARVLLGAGGWFLAAALVAVVEPLWRLVGLPGAFTSPADAVVFVLTATGVAAVLLSAVAVGVARVEGRVAPERDDDPGGAMEPSAAER